MVAVKQVIKREAYEPKFGMKGVEHATPHARVEQTANLSEQSGCLRPGHIVQIPRYDDRRVVSATLLATIISSASRSEDSSFSVGLGGAG